VRLVRYLKGKRAILFLHNVNRTVRCIAVHLEYTVCLFVFLALQPIVVIFSQPSSGLLPPRFRGFLITHNDTPQSVGLLWMSDQSVAETSI
jgi:hypothetical protein